MQDVEWIASALWLIGMYEREARTHAAGQAGAYYHLAARALCKLKHALGEACAAQAGLQNLLT
jgi:hypothetical protein